MATDLTLGVETKGAAKTAAELKALAKSVDDLGDEAARLGRKFDEASDEAAELDRQLLKTKATTALLAKEFAKTGDTGVKAKLDAERAAAKEIQRLHADIIGDTEKDSKAATRAWQKASVDLKRAMGQSGKDGADTFAQFFEGGILKALSDPKIAAASGVVAAGLAVQVGAVVGGAVLAGAGVGAAALGVAGAASQSKAVGDAWAEQIERLKMQWLDASKPFIGPTIAAAHEFGDVMSSVHLDKILGTAAGYFAKLVPAAGTFSRYVIAGFESLVENAGPVIDVLAEELPDIGLAINMFSEDIASGAEGGASALKDLLDVIEGVIVGTGKFVGGAEHAYDAVKRFSEGARDLVDHLRETNGLLYVALAPANFFGDLLHDDADKAERFGQAMSGLSSNVADFGAAATTAFYNTADAADAANAAFDRLFGEMMSLDEATLAVTEGQLQLIETLKENGRTLDATTQKGIDNKQAILAQIETLNRQREAAIAAGNGTLEATQKANAAYASQLASLRQLLINMGFAPAVIDAIIDKYRELANLGNITKTFTVQYRQSGTPMRGFSRYPGEASGTPSAAAGLTWVGEEGPELVDFRGGERVYNATESARMMAGKSTGWNGGGGGGTRMLQPVSIQIDGREVVRVVMEADRRGQFQIRQSAVVA